MGENESPVPAINWPRFLLGWVAGCVVVTASEVVRNEVVIRHLWDEAFRAMGKVYPSGPSSGVVWLAWSFALAGLTSWTFLLVSTRFGTTYRAAMVAGLTTWATFFLLFWVGVMNMGLFPVGIMAVALPWSLAELVAAAALMAVIYRHPESSIELRRKATPPF